MVGAVITGVVLAAVAAALIYPIVRPPLEPITEPGGPADRLAALEERKLGIYGAIRDLGFDYRTDKLTDEDYRSEVATLKAEAVQLVAEIERLRSEVPRGPSDLEAEIAREIEALEPAERRPSAGRFCTACGAKASPQDRYCAACGQALGSPA